MFAEALFIVAVLCGCVAALRGGVAAVALLSATALVYAFTLAGVGFHPVLWMLVGAGAIMAIIRPGMSGCDALIVAMFCPTWTLYFVDGWAAYYGTLLLSSAQFLLTFPGPQLFAKCTRAFRRSRDDSGNLEMAANRG